MNFFQASGKNLLAAEAKAGVRHHVAALIQPILSDDVVSVLAEIALGPAVNGTVEVGGPERFRFQDFVARTLSASKDKRKVVGDPHARDFGAELQEESLVTGSKARIGQMRYDAWLTRASSSH